MANNDSGHVSMVGYAMNTSQTVDPPSKSYTRISKNSNKYTKPITKPKSSRSQRYQIDEESASDPTYS